jgi:AraC family transcriptional regulator of adaptative response/methylated-DNA-[protein]-cysteine methyltransferase
MEAVTPGQFKSGGAGVKPGYGSHELPFGRTSIALSNNGPTDLVFVDEKHESKALNVLEEKQSAAEIAKASEATGKIAKRVFGGIAGSAGAGSIKLCLRGQFSDKGLAGASENP